jgi:hypothetical protein
VSSYIYSSILDLCLTVHHQSRYSKYGTPTRCNNTSFIDLQDQLNKFRAYFCPSSGAQDLDFLQHMVQYPVMWYAGVSERVVWHYVYVCMPETC